MKKRVLLCMLAALVILMGMIFAGCNKSGDDAGSAGSAGGAVSADDAYETFIAAAEALNNAENAAMDMNMSMSGESAGMTMSGPVQMMREDGKLQMRIDVTMEMSGQEMHLISYYKDGFLYAEMSGMKIKTARSENEILTANNSGAQIFDKEYVKDMKAEVNADGTLITMTIDGKGLGALVESGMAQGGSVVTETDIEYNDAVMLVQLDNDGKMTMQDITMSFSVAGEETEIHSVLSDVSYGGEGIVFPDDLDTYQEIAAQ